MIELIGYLRTISDVTLSTRPFSFALETSSSYRLFSYKSSFIFFQELHLYRRFLFRYLRILEWEGFEVTTVGNRCRAIMFPGGSKL